MFIETLYAAGGAAGAQPNPIAGFIPIILIFVVFYFLLIRPQQKRAKQHREMIQNLQKGDEIITSGGLYGKIVGITDEFLTLEVAENVKVKVARTYVSTKLNQQGSTAKNPTKEGKK